MSGVELAIPGPVILGPREGTWAARGLAKLKSLDACTAVERLRTLSGYSQKLYSFRGAVVGPLQSLGLIAHDVAQDTVVLTAQGRQYLGMPATQGSNTAAVARSVPARAPRRTGEYSPPARLVPRAESLALLNEPSLFGGARIVRQSVLGQ